ncbi:MAG: polynucleotide kinase-phosphatase [Planctomycetes bacterium]|nr:polynucleotide kinase-phosphatase [Planctomycetota bacterium]
MLDNKISIRIPELSLVVLVGSSGSGKSYFCQKHFKPTQIVSSDFCRGIISDDINNQGVTPEAFELLNFIISKRADLRKLTVVDATSLRHEDRENLINLARRHHILPVAIVFDVNEKTCWARTQQRPDRDFGRHVVRTHNLLLKKTIRNIKREGFTGGLYILNEDEIDNAEIVFSPLFNNKRNESGPFDIIGDVHGCYDELIELVEKLGYRQENGLYKHPDNRKLIFVGDLTDRGPKIIETVNFVINHSINNLAYVVRGNHDKKFTNYLRGQNVRIDHGLEQTIAQLESLPEAERIKFKEQYQKYERNVISHYIFDQGNLAVAHAGITEYFQGRGSAQITDFCLYGQTTGEIDGYGLPVRLDWSENYRGKALVVYGHIPVEEAEFANNTIDIDQGCVFGGRLTALRYPERELIYVEAKAQYYTPTKTFSKEADEKEKSNLTKQQRYDHYLDITEFIGKKFISVHGKGMITVFPEQIEAAIEVVSRFCVDHRWLTYIPPTMSPCETSQLSNYLEYPTEAFSYYKKRGIPNVICEEKHMGSRAILILCKDEKACLNRFGLEAIGQCYTRTGRQFFKDNELQQKFLRRLVESLTANNWWEKFDTDWVIIDAEVIPWNLKAGELLINQYELVATTAKNTLQKMYENVLKASQRGVAITELKDSLSQQLKDINAYQKAYQNYCWQVSSLDDIKIAPFHLLATENRIYTDKNHTWHMETLGELASFDKIWKKTPFLQVETINELSCQQGIDWWLEITNKGAEGMVIKPSDFIVYSKGRLVQPALKCRGKEYLRIIYGPSYDAQVNLERLRNRGLRTKRSLAEKEFVLGIEGLTRFVRNEPLRRVHECALGVLAMESETTDPRL